MLRYHFNRTYKNQNTLSEFPPALAASEEADQDILFTYFDITLHLFQNIYRTVIITIIVWQKNHNR